MAIVTESRLRAFAPRCPDPASWSRALDAALDRFQIVTPERVAAFMAQIAHESGELRRLVENLNYSAAGLHKTWKKRFPSVDFALAFERQPEKIANFVYANRLGNGNGASGDGWRYRGRGILQITGRSNYRSAGIALGIPLEDEPEQLEKPAAAAMGAAHFWQSRGLNELADHRDSDNDDEDFVAITRLINGGTIGMSDRIEYWQRAKGIFTGGL